MNSTLISAEPWQRSILTSRSFKRLAELLGMGLEHDSKGVWFGGSKRLADDMEKLWGMGKTDSKSDKDLDILIAIKRKIDKLGTNLTGESLAKRLLMDIKFKELQEDRDQEVLEEKALATKQREQEREEKALRPVETVKKVPTVNREAEAKAHNLMRKMRKEIEDLKIQDPREQ